MARRPAPLALKDRAEIIWELSMAYGALVDAEAPDDLIRGVAYWLRTTTRLGLTAEDLEHVLDAAQPMARKP